MEKYFDTIKKTPLFAGIADNELESMLCCLNAKKEAYPKGGSIFIAGDPASFVGLVLSGSAQVVRDDALGNRTILTKLIPGELFGETFACAGIKTLPVSVITGERSQVLLLDYKKIISTCPSSCAFHSLMIENMLQILAKKNLGLNRKIEAMSARTTRGKLLSYLTLQANSAGSLSFEIPFSRQELADYLSVDRSAMSAELSRMQRDGLLKFHKNHFELTGHS